MEDTARAVMERCDVLAGISEEPGLIVRPYGSRAMKEANDVVAGWMRLAGMTTRRDAFGNLIGRYEGTGEKTLILGSHLDTVRDAGKYNGILGVTVALACVQRLHDRGERLPYAVEVVGFADEEGLRFGTTFLGSSAYAGAFDGSRLSLKDRVGVTLREAIRAFGGDPGALEGGGRKDKALLGYCEVHIEQGPVLEERDLPVGVVTAINGQSRVKVGFVGNAGHAGTVPMDPDLGALLGMAVEGSGMPVHRLPSGAGHDAAQMAALTPVAMLFVRCKGGISHNPAESVRREDAGVAVEVLGRFLTLLAKDDRSGNMSGASREVR